MPDYSNGKIYKIHSFKTDLKYYGSTTVELCKRSTGHKTDMKRGRTITSKQILEYDDAMITLVELFPCDSKSELLARERWYIENNQCVNKYVPGRTDAECRIANKVRLDRYRELNKDKIKNVTKLYNDKNKDIRKQRRKDNKEYIKQYEYWRNSHPIGILARAYF